MSVADRIERKLAEALRPVHLEVVNESGSHNVPPGSESHFKVVLVSESFDGQRLLARHRQVNAVLAEELARDIHALAIHTYTRDEWRWRFGDAPLSPPCLGGKRLEAESEGVSTDVSRQQEYHESGSSGSAVSMNEAGETTGDERGGTAG